ncbi:MAPEG family protein [Shimia ponticola]|uniref:MAPEG family protein n=1 Tax=Shimia ponticola TaxID=2582893 RepID=UPI0011BE9B82|nr:MAPEG family protein [Shimia ponticola]
MTPELTALTLSALLQVIQFALMSISANLDLGPGKTMSPRDQSRLGGPLETQLSDGPARLYRAFNNHFESLALFTIACVVITLSDQSTGFTAACAYTYLIARVAYIPAYYFGLVPWRSLIWLLGFMSITAMLIAALI